MEANWRPTDKFAAIIDLSTRSTFTLLPLFHLALPKSIKQNFYVGPSISMEVTTGKTFALPGN
jgi:hypothetical protein